MSFKTIYLIALNSILASEHLMSMEVSMHVLAVIMIHGKFPWKHSIRKLNVDS